MDFKINQAKLDSIRDPELDKILDDLSECYNRLMIYMIKKDLGVDVQIIDDEHIAIDGQVLNSDEFADWLDMNYPYEDDWYDDDQPHHYDA